jgi:two-component system, OmpR family, sensor histidine kinase KdpD
VSVTRLDELVRKLTLTPARRRASGILACIAGVALVTGLIYGFREFVPVLSLGALYVFAVVPIAVVWGRAYAIPVSVASMLAFNFFFLPPVHTLTLADRENWFALAVYLVTAVVVSDLAARARRRTAEAEQRERETALLAQISTALLSGSALDEELPGVADRVADVLGADAGRIELGPRHEPPRGESPLELEVGGRFVGTLYVREGPEPNLPARRRFLPALASLLAVASDRERLAQDAVEAAALRRSDTVKTAVLRAVSHDFRSPLTAIRVAVDGLSSEELALGPADRASLLETVQVETGRLERLVANLLDLSRLEAGAAQPEPELWTVDELVGQALEELGTDRDRVRVELGAETPPVRVDAAQVQRVLVNLLDNALRFSPFDAGVLLRVTHTRRDVILRVVDQGPGVPEADLERIFDPFEIRSEIDVHSGTGLGLAIARGFAEANGGRVWAESRPGQGASFALALPAESPAPVAA